MRLKYLSGRLHSSRVIPLRPQGSTATLNGANTARRTFTPDVAGSYVLCLTVNDGQAGSAPDSVVVEARVAPFKQTAGHIQNPRDNPIVLKKTDRSAGP